MTKTDRVRYEMLLRVRDFGASQGAAFPGSSKGGQTFARVAQAVADIDAHDTARLLAAHEGRRAKTAARRDVRRWMLAIAMTARDLTRATPELEKTLRMPRRSSEVVLLGAARSFLEAAARIDNDLVDLGLPSTFLADFREAVDTFEEQMGARRAGRGAVAAARKGIDTALAAGMNAARTLDVVVTNTVGLDPVLFARWQRDRRLVDGRTRGAEPVAIPPVQPAVGTETNTPPADAGGIGHEPVQPSPQALALAPVPTSDTPLDLDKAS